MDINSVMGVVRDFTDASMSFFMTSGKVVLVLSAVALVMIFLWSVIRCMQRAADKRRQSEAVACGKQAVSPEDEQRRRKGRLFNSFALACSLLAWVFLCVSPVLSAAVWVVVICVRGYLKGEYGKKSAVGVWATVLSVIGIVMCIVLVVAVAGVVTWSVSAPVHKTLEDLGTAQVQWGGL